MVDRGKNETDVHKKSMRIQLNRTQICSQWPRGSREPCDQLVQSYGDRHSTGKQEHLTTWINEAVHIYKEGQHAMNRDEGSYQLSHVYDRRPLSWHSILPSCQEPEELSTSFFWWRPLIEAETSL